jgi:hypothetical protein
MLQTTLEKITLHVIESTPCRQRSLEIKFLGGKGIPTFFSFFRKSFISHRLPL